MPVLVNKSKTQMLNLGILQSSLQYIIKYPNKDWLLGYTLYNAKEPKGFFLRISHLFILEKSSLSAKETLQPHISKHLVMKMMKN